MTAVVGAALFTGAFTWTLLEYLIHRFAGHDRRLRGNPFGVEHVRHHIEGDYFAPSYKKAIVALVAIAALSAPLMLALGGPTGAAFIVGLVGCYGVYEVIHRRLHVSAGFGAYGRWARRHHFTHHFASARVNHGVTTPLWDFVFGTYQAPAHITVPGRLCMAWLKDPATGQVRAEWADAFSIY